MSTPFDPKSLLPDNGEGFTRVSPAQYEHLTGMLYIVEEGKLVKGWLLSHGRNLTHQIGVGSKIVRRGGEVRHRCCQNDRRSIGLPCPIKSDENLGTRFLEIDVSTCSVQEMYVVQLDTIDPSVSKEESPILWIKDRGVAVFVRDRDRLKKPQTRSAEALDVDGNPFADGPPQKKTKH